MDNINIEFVDNSFEAKCCLDSRAQTIRGGGVSKGSQPDDVRRTTNENWDWTTETREWSAAATGDRCFNLARLYNKDLDEIIDTKRVLLRYICIFKEKEQ